MNTNPNNNTNIPLSQRRLKTKPALTLMAILLAGNIFWFVLWLWSSNDDNSSDETVATIADVEITKEQWLAEIEALYGKETLQQMVNNSVMEQAAKKYKIEVTDEEIDLEIALLQVSQDVNDTLDVEDKQLRKQVKAQIILEKVLAKDIVIDEAQIEDHYKENESFFNAPTAYRTNVIVVQTEQEATTVLEELKNGSEFSVLAREKSLHIASASLGGDIGFISEGQEGVEPAIVKAVQGLNEKELSSVVKLQDGTFAIVQLQEMKEAQAFSLEEVKDYIYRDLAMQQLANSITPEMFWDEFGVEWFYGEVK